MNLQPVETEIGRITDPVERLAAFIRERESMRTLKEAGETILGKECVVTDDPILRAYRFCNVRREDDRVTRWIAENWRSPHNSDSNLWFAMVVARFVNWPDTLAEIGYPVPWGGGYGRAKFLTVMARRKESGAKLYTGAYMVRADREHKDKAAYQEEVVFTPMWEKRRQLQPKEGDTLNSYHMLLGQFHGLGSFMAAQIVADLKYVEPLASASDWWTFAASGPGSRRGLTRAYALPMNNTWTEEGWRLDLARLMERVQPLIGGAVGTIHAQDLQNCLCEFDKYERVRLGEGRPRARYKA